MKKYILTVGISLLMALPVMSENKEPSKPGKGIVSQVTVTSTVEDIDYKSRHVKLKADDGKVTNLTVGPLARNFNQVKKGDRVTIQYTEALAVDVKKAEGELGEQANVSIERAAKGSKPSGVVTGTYAVTASVEDIDYDTRHVTLKRPDGENITLKVGDAVKRLNEVKKGDHVVVKYTEALGISVTTPKG
jgi:hypothetical protein